MWAYSLIAPARFEQTELPDPGEQDVPDGSILLRTLAGGICGSDLPPFRKAADEGGRAHPLPGSPLHEVAGEVVVSKHPAHAVGDTVVGWASRFDAIAEYTVTDGAGLVAYDPSLAATTAIAIQPLACVLYAVERMTGVAGTRAAVLGQGPIGLLFSHVLNERGARVTGVDRVDRSSGADVFGVTETVTASADDWASSLRESDRPQLIVEAIGHQVTTLGDAVDAVASGGQIFYFGLADDLTYPLEMTKLIRKNLTLRAGGTLDRRRVLGEAAGYLAAHRELRDAYVTHVFKVGEVQRAFDVAVVPKPGQFKVAIDMVA
jgi:threonine dehydrogenase-like Zn-dependent dehydrogenase